MSSTNRGGQRNADDFYATEPWVTRAIAPYLPTEGDVLDPCAGEGAILDVFATTRIERRAGATGRFTSGIEIDPTRAVACGSKYDHVVVIGDALGIAWPVAQTIITNPPFCIAEEIVRRAISFAAETEATVAMLLRLAFLESEKRIALHRDFPADVFPLAYRPSFTPDGKTDSCAYAWFRWDMRDVAHRRRLRHGGVIRVLTDRPPRKKRERAA